MKGPKGEPLTNTLMPAHGRTNGPPSFDPDFTTVVFFSRRMGKRTSMSSPSKDGKRKA